MVGGSCFLTFSEDFSFISEEKGKDN